MLSTSESEVVIEREDAFNGSDGVGNDCLYMQTIAGLTCIQTWPSIFACGSIVGQWHFAD
jgi:hypothetical protein